MTDMDKIMIEKVARAIYDAAQAEAVRRGHDADTLPTYDTDDEEARSACLELARAAIAAYNPDDRLRRVGTLFAAIEHGDETHRAWLKEAIDKHFAGEAVPAPKGNGNSDRLREALEAIVDRAPERDIKWAGMTARDIAIAALSPLPQGDT